MAFYRAGLATYGVVLVWLMLFGGITTAAAQPNTVTVVTDNMGSKLQIDGADFMVIGMNWDYFPIGTNYTYSLWSQPDDIIRDALAGEMSLLKAMGVNTIRMYTGVPPRWVQYIYEEYGIYTVLNHSFGRYGVTIDGVYTYATNYADPRTRQFLLDEVKAMVNEFKNTPGLLMWLLGNENNYGLVWSSAETEALPEGEQQAAKARYMYSLFGEATRLIQSIDTNHPVSMANGDIQYLDIIAEEVPTLDIFGTNVYRGISVGDLFQDVKEKMGIPVMFTEFGCDAYNAKEMREDQYHQAQILLGQWQEIYEQSYGKGRVGNAIGGLTFQFSDGWWKYLQEENLDVHDTHASWPNGGYPFDYVEGENNMNEEWWGICAKGPTNERGLYQLYPRAAYYALMRAYELQPYDPETTLETIRAHFGGLNPMVDVLRARGDNAALTAQRLQKVRVSGLRMEFETISSGGNNVSTPDNLIAGEEGTYPAFKGFDHLQSYYVDVEAKPADNVRATVSINYLGHVPVNPIDEIFYENRGRPKTVLTPDGRSELSDIERLKVYNASVSWESKWFNLDGFYRTGHYHWGYEGDFFGLYREANYGPNIDTYNGEAPLGIEVTGKKALTGLKIAYGPELWWGANPAVLMKYQRRVGPFQMTGIVQEDIDNQVGAVSSFAVPEPTNRKATLHLKTTRGIFGVEVGGIMSGQTKIDETFQVIRGSEGNYTVYQDQIKMEDTFGGKIKLTATKGKIKWYAQGAAMGLVADGGPDATQTYTGWRLKDSGSGNQWNILSGFTYNINSAWQVAPNFLWQKPVEGPIPAGVPAPGKPRNILDDPFAVRSNRETTAGELLITYDPTPGSWMYAWDSDEKEDAKLAASVGFVFRHQPTTQDAAIGILGDGRTTFAFDGAPPARDVWEAHARIVSKFRPDMGLIANLYGGIGEPNGNDAREITRYGVDVRLALQHIKIQTSVKIDDWGPYDYHRDFNLTYPLQLEADVSHVLGKIDWFDVPQTRWGVNVKWRSLDRYSPRYCPVEVVNDIGVLECDPTAPGQDEGNEWEIRTYLHVNVR